MQNELVICNCVDDVQFRNTELDSLRNKLQKTLRRIVRFTPMTWVDSSNSGITITENKYIAKIDGASNWDKAARTELPLTTGVNIVEFVTEKDPPQDVYTMHERIIVVGVHPTSNLVAGQCNPGFHVSSVGVKFGATFTPQRVGVDEGTNWLSEGVIRMEVDFITDQIRIYDNDELKIVNLDSHKPSLLAGCYITFMVNTPNTRIRILSSSMVWH